MESPKPFLPKKGNFKVRPISLIGLICLISLMGFTACSSDGDVAGEEPTPTPQQPTTPTEQYEAIRFGSGLADEEQVSRGNGLNEQKTAFTVWGYKNSGTNYDGKQTVFDGYAVEWVGTTTSTTTNSHGWEYILTNHSNQTIKYWDWSATAYRFFGLTDNLTLASASGDATERSVTMTVDASSDEAIAALPYYSHLWFGLPTYDENPRHQFGQVVQLEFLKPIAQVRFIFTFVPEMTRAGVDRSKLSSISFRPTPPTDPNEQQKAIANKGTVTISYPLTGIQTKESFTSEPTDFFTKFDIDSYEDKYGVWHDHWYNVLPRESQGSYTLSVVVVGGDPKTASVPAAYMTWSPGYQYTYVFKITESGGVTLDEIQVGINDWHKMEDITHPVYNW